jgi:hypothetical protein
MANTKISALTSATTPLAGTETLPIVQSGSTVKATVANITGAGTYSGSFTTLLTTGNVGFGAVSPTQPLVVTKNQNGSTWMNVVNTTSGTGAAAGLLMTGDATNQATIELDSTGHSGFPNALRVRQIGANPIVFSTSDTERARFDSAGNFLLRTTSVGNATSGGTIRFGASGLGVVTTVYENPVANLAFKDIALNNGGGSWSCLLLVSVTSTANGNAATRTTYAVLGRGTTATFTSLATQNGSTSGASFTVTCPSNGVMRITNTFGSNVEITATAIGQGN